MSYNLHGQRSTAARRVASLMGRRPNLKIKRPGWPRYRWYGWSNEGYQSWLELERQRIARLPRAPEGRAKRIANHLHFLKPGTFFRLVDGHGKSYGKRYQRGVDDVWLEPTDNVRVVARQEEDLHSQLSRMMKRAHKLAMRD